MVKVNVPPQFCTLCKSTKDIRTDHNAGSDVDPDGEEEQHMDYCKCGAERLWGVRHPFEGESYMWHEEWRKA